MHIVDANGELLHITLMIDNELKALIPPLTSDELSLLEASIKADGCRDAVVIWEGENVVVDGHNRYAICQRNNLPLKVQFKKFDSREDVVVWMIHNQFARRNLSSYQRGELALRLKDAIAAKAKSNQSHGMTAPNKTLRPNSDEAFGVRTDETLGKIAGVGKTTIRQVEEIAAKASEPIKAAARRGDISTNEAFELTRVLKDAPEAVKEQVNASFSAGNPVNSKKLKTLVKEQRRADKAAIQNSVPAGLPERDQRFNLIVGDFQEVCTSLPEASFDAIITDPPYPEEFLPLYGSLASVASRLLKPGGVLLAMCGQSYLPQIMQLMTPHLNYHWVLSYQTLGGQSAQLWQRSINTFWKPIIWMTKGEYQGDWVGDVIKSDANDKRFHHWGQSESGMAELVKRFTKPGDHVLDPFLGGGTTGVVCVDLNRKFTGIDIEKDNVNVSRARMYEMEGAA
jgi:hypothetical protein